MSPGRRLAAFIAAVVLTTAATRMAAAQPSIDNFTYRPPGEMTFTGDRGVRDRRVFFPMMAFPLRVGPEAGGDGRLLRAYANSQVYRPTGFDANDPRLYVYPWVDTLCESRHVGGPMPVCPATPRHQGVDIRPNSPSDRTYDEVAWADGIVTYVQSSGTSEVNIRYAGNNSMECVYLHLRPANLRTGQQVRKGDVIGKVSNLMTGGGTSIHLHFQCKATHPEIRRTINMPIYTSLIAAYRRAWGLPDMVENGVLLRDPERELDSGNAGPTSGDPTCTEPLSAPLASAAGRTFTARYLHNCSEMGLAIDSGAQKMELVYVRPKQSLQQAAARKPLLVSGTLKSNGDFAGEAINFNRDCHDPTFKVTGHVDTSATEIMLQGDRQVLDNGCTPVGSRHETLRFAKLVSTPPSTEPPPVASGLNCPFALPPGQRPQIVDGREIPPKSERACNFTALTVPGNLGFDEMPRYIREWPGVRKDVLIDRFEDQIITFQTAETGVGAWWYWVVYRAVNGSDLSRRGFGANGRPTLSAVARAIAGADRSEEYVRRTYLAPYLAFASEYFGRVVAENDGLDLSDANVRWNLGRTMFRLESGRTPVVSRKQFDCGVALSNDVGADFGRAGVESGSATAVTFTSFKGLQFYIDNCTGPGPVVTPTPAPDNLAEVQAKLAQANQQIQTLSARVNELQAQLQFANAKVSDLQRRIDELTSASPTPPPQPGDADTVELEKLRKENAELSGRVQTTTRELELTNQILNSERELCKLKEPASR